MGRGPNTIDAYLATLRPDQQHALSDLRQLIRSVLPDSQEVISYNMPGFRVGKNLVADFAGFAVHCGYYPHSGHIIPAFADRLADFKWTPGAIQFTPAHPLPDDLVHDLIAARLAEIA